MNENHFPQKITISAIRRSIVVLFCLFSVFLTSLQASTDSKTPLMGWASWNNFHVDISSLIIQNQADAMVSSGLSTVGFKYINIDDGFFDGRNADGSLRIDAVKFPTGMKTVADYIHSKGLKVGFYSEAGANTCGSRPTGGNQPGGIGAGLYNHDQQDIDSIFKKWGYDFIKVDYCGGSDLKLNEETRYTAIKTAIDKTGRTDIKYNVCRWRFPGSWVTTIADSWRISGDITAAWSSVTSIIDKNAFLAAYASPGHFNDMDMLEVGRGMTNEEDKSHFSMWCIMSSPLVLGNDLSTMTQQTKDILSNTEVIAVNQDSTGEQAHLVSDDGAGLQVWAKHLNGRRSSERAVALLNRSAVSATITVRWKDLNLVGSAVVRNLWTHTNLGSVDSVFTATVPSHGVVMLKVIGNKSNLQEVFEAENGWINNFNISLNASVVADQGRATVSSTCSGRAKAGYLGNRADNYLEFRNIYADSTKTYPLTISYISGENRNTTLTVNGKDTLLANLNSGTWTAIASITVVVKLNKGNNIIRLSNATGWMPDMDKIYLPLNLVKNTPTGIRQTTESLSRVHPNPCTSFLQIDSKQPITQVKLYSLTGCLLRTYQQSTISVADLATGHYLLKVITDKSIVMHRIIKE
jgi:hypothetical protein